jgi:serine/threonine-protein kinase
MTGQTLGNYQIIEKLGMGGIMTVYKAYDPSRERYVILEILHSHLADDPKFSLLLKEQAYLRLDHPNIPVPIEYGKKDGFHYLVNEYLPDSISLSDRLRNGPLPFGEISHILDQVANALDYAHGQNILHCDVKPSNILLDNQRNVYLMDFGMAKIMENGTFIQSSLEGSITGTPQYMSPEAAQGDPLTPAADIYSLGVVLYEMVTGNPPFQAWTPMAVVMKHISEPPPPPRQFRSDLPEAVDLVLFKVLAKESKSRYQTASMLAVAYKQAVQKVLSVQPQSADQTTKDLDNVKREITIVSRRLQKLREIQAIKGVDTEPHYLIEIEDLEQKLATLQDELRE